MVPCRTAFLGVVSPGVLCVYRHNNSTGCAPVCDNGVNRTESAHVRCCRPTHPTCRAASTTAAAPPAPKLAVMVHAAYNLPGSSNSSSNSDGTTAAAHGGAGQHSSAATSKGASECYYVRAGLHHSHSPLAPLQQQKTQPVMASGGHVCWPNGLLQLEPHREVDSLEVVLQLKRRTRLTGSSGEA